MRAEHVLRRKSGWIVALTILLVARVFSIAAAHATLVSSEPSSGTRLAFMPARVRLVFSEPVEPGLTHVTLTNSAGESVALPVRGDPHDVHAVISSIANAGAVAPEQIRVTWHVVSADGHPVSGSFVFSVGLRGAVGGAPPPESLAMPKSAVWGPSVAGAPLVPAALRAIGDACLLALIGLLVFVVGAGDQGGRPARVALWLSIAAPICLGAHLVVWLINVSPDHRLSAAWVSASIATTVVRVELWRTGLSLLPLWALGLARRPGVALALTVPAILASSAVGHSAAVHPMLAIPLKATHLVAVGLWLGGLVWIVACDRVGPRFVADVLRVSTVALWSVILVTITGIIQTLILVPSISGLASPYGAVVFGKVIGLALLVAFGAYHRRRIIPRLRPGDDGELGALKTSVARELSVFCAVLLLAAFLAYLSPPIHVATGASSPSSEMPE
jgi:copper transport protein